MVTLCEEVETKINSFVEKIVEDMDIDQQLHDLCENMEREHKGYSSPILPLNIGLMMTALREDYVIYYEEETDQDPSHSFWSQCTQKL